MINREKCVLCGSTDLRKAFALEDLPVYAGVTTQNSELDMFCSQEYCICNKCSLVQLHKLVEIDKLYNFSNHNSEIVGAIWKKHFIELNKFIGNLDGKNVYEIGDPSLKTNRFNKSNYKSWTVIDPSFELTNSLAHERIVVKKKFWEDVSHEEYKDYPPDVFVTSHTVEHFYNPIKSLRKIANSLQEGGHLFISVPNMKYLAEFNLWPFNGVFFEHTFWCSPLVLSEMIRIAGFQVEEIKYFENHSVFFKCKKVKKEAINLKNNYLDENRRSTQWFNNSIQHFKQYVKEINETVSKEERPWFLFGAHYYSQVLISMGLDTTNLKCILDNASGKWNKRLYGTNFECKSPEILRKEDSPYVVCILGSYTDEIKKGIISNINNKTRFFQLKEEK